MRRKYAAECLEFADFDIASCYALHDELGDGVILVDFQIGFAGIDECHLDFAHEIAVDDAFCNSKTLAS